MSNSSKFTAKLPLNHTQRSILKSKIRIYAAKTHSSRARRIGLVCEQRNINP